MDETGIVGASPTCRVTVGMAEPTGQEVLDAAREAASTTRVAAVGSTGVTELEPLILATRDGETAFHAGADASTAREVAAELDDGDLPTEGALAVVEHDPGTDRLPVPPETPLAVGRRRVLAGAGWVAPASVDDFERATADGETVRERADGLDGRGRGDASADRPVGEEWATAREAAGDPVVVVNGNEADSAAGMDHTLLASLPLVVLDGALAVARAVGAADVVVYLGEDDALARGRVTAARDALVAEGEFEVDIEVVGGPADYRAGEPTMALEAMEGADRIEARRRPPGPATYGLYGRPTVVHTPRTVAQVHAALRDDDLDADAADPGTRLVTVAGDVTAPATVELPTDAALSRALDAVSFEGMRFACVGGQFGGLTRDLDVPASAPALRGADLGTNGVVEVFGGGACAVATAGHRAAFARRENCGRCVPCREGSGQLTDLLREVYDGEYAAGKLRELTRVMRESSLCAFGRDAARTVATAMDEFEAEFVAHANGRCPTGACEEVDG